MTDKAVSKDSGLHVRRRGIVTIAGLAVTAGAWGISQSAEFVESVYAQGISPLLSRGLSSATGVVVTSVAELILALVTMWLVVPGVCALYNIARRRRRILNAVACGVLRTVMLGSVTVALFYVLWGVNYARAPLVQRQGWQEHARSPDDAEAQAAELSGLCEALVTAANDSYLAAFRCEDLGSPSGPLMDGPALDNELEVGVARGAQDLKLEAAFQQPRGRAKPVAASELMCRLQISGFYFPWTGEANYNRLQPGCQLPHTIAHEKAHQRGVTSEDEANFLGFAACVRADDPSVRYSGYLFAQRQLLGELVVHDSEGAQKLLKQRLPGVQRDVDNLKAFWAQYEGAVAEAGHAINDTYLKINGVKGGVRSYGQSAQLLVVYARRFGGIVAGVLVKRR